MVCEEMSLKCISYLEILQPFCLGAAEPFVLFGKGHYEQTFLWKYFEFGTVVQEEMLIKDISCLQLWWPFLFSGVSGTICAMLADGIMKNFYVILCWICTRGSGGDAI